MSSGNTTGTLSRYPLPRLLAFLEKKKFSGSLQLTNGTALEALIRFDQGVPVEVAPNTDQKLAQLLMQRGRIDSSQYAIALRAVAGGATDLDQALAEQAEVTAEEMQSFRRLLLFTELCRIFQHEEGNFELSSEAATTGRLQASSAVEPLYLIYNGIKSSYSEPRLRREMAKILDQAISLKGVAAGALEAFNFGDEEKRPLAYLGKGYWLADDLISALGGDPGRVLMLVYTVWVADLLKVAAPDAVPRLRAKKTEAPPAGPRRTPGPSRTTTRYTKPAEATPITDASPITDVPPEKPPSERFPRVSSAKLRSVSASYRAPMPGKRAGRAPSRTFEKPLTQSVTLQGVGPGADPLILRSREAAAKLQSAGGLAQESINLMEDILARLERAEQMNPFQTLGLTLEADSSDVKVAYSKLVKRFHPDKVGSIGLADLRDAADAVFSRINEAHSQLATKTQLDNAREIFADEGSAKDAQAARMAVQAEFDFQKGEVYFRKGDMLTAEQHFRDAVEGNPDEGEHYAMLAWTIYMQTPVDQRLSIHKEMKEFLDRAIALSPKCARAHFFLGKVLLNEKKTKLALESFQRAAANKRQYIEALREIRLIKMRKDRARTEKSSTLMNIFRRKK